MTDATSADGPDDGDLFVSPEGDDGWSGERPDPGDGDGPFRTVERAMEEVRFRRRAGGFADGTVWLRGGRYALDEPLTFGPDDGGVTYAAYPGEEPVVSGGRAIEGWEETTVNGVDAWRTTLPEVRDGDRYVRQLFVDGERAARPRVPDVGDLAGLDAEDFRWIEDVPGLEDTDMIRNIFSGSGSFRTREGEVEAWHEPTDVEVVVCHYWVGERIPVAAVDPETRRIDLDRESSYGLIDDSSGGFARYYLENVFEALSEPGEWYLDRDGGELYYVPREGESIEEAEVVAPWLDDLVRIEGDPGTGEYVDDLRFEGVAFEHARMRFEESTQQSAASIGGAVALSGARNCALVDGAVRHVGGYGVELGPGTRRCRVVGNEIADLGAGGVTTDGERWEAPGRTGHNAITDNHVHDGGHVHHAGVGVLARNVFDTEIAHNHVHDFFYTGVSCGWEWGYDVQVAADNRIEHNHIHDVGKGLLSDMGGIYTLGVQPGTVLRGNHIHDVTHWNYGGRGIYPDEGSSHLLIEDNVVHDVSEHALHQHYGRENLVRNNVFARGEEGVVGISRDEFTGFEWRRERVIRPNRSDPYGDRFPSLALSRGPRGGGFTFLRNVVIGDDQPLFVGGGGEYGTPLSEHPFTSEANALVDRAGEPTCADGGHGHGETDDASLTIEEWRDLGNDRTSVVGAPGVRVEDGVVVDADAPALDVGFDPIELEAGPRPPAERP